MYDIMISIIIKAQCLTYLLFARTVFSLLCSLKMKPDVVLRHLSIAVAANDQSYMPQQVTVAVGRNASSLQEVRDVHIPSNITGYVTLLENANISQMCESIKIPLGFCFGAFCKAKGWVDHGEMCWSVSNQGWHFGPCPWVREVVFILL